MATLPDVTTLTSALVQSGLGILAPHWVIRWDVARLDGRRRRRTWPEASHWCAVVLFGPIAVWVHYVRTRRSVLGTTQGLLAAAVAAAPSVLFALLFP